MQALPMQRHQMMLIRRSQGFPADDDQVVLLRERRASVPKIMSWTEPSEAGTERAGNWIVMMRDHQVRNLRLREVQVQSGVSRVDSRYRLLRKRIRVRVGGVMMKGSWNKARGKNRKSLGHVE
jgi:hypothetical protein